MGSFFSVLQGVLFSAMNTAVLAFLAHDVVARHVDVELAPRILVLFAGIMFLLGTAFMLALTTRRDPDSGELASGGIGTLLAAMAGMYALALVAMVTKEMTLLLLPVLFALYAFATISVHVSSRFTAPLVSLLVLVITLIAFSDLSFADPLADGFSRYFDFEPSRKVPGYLEERGGFFAAPLVAPVLVAATTFALVSMHQKRRVIQ